MSSLLTPLKSFIKNTALFFFILLTTQDLFADAKFDVSANAGYVGNMLNDSSRTEDFYSGLRASTNLYPFPKVEINLHGDYTYYSKIYNLSSFLGGGGIKFIPTDKESPLSILTSFSFDMRDYRSKFDQYKNNNYDATLLAGYKVLDNINIRGGMAFNSLVYTDIEGTNKETFKCFTGINVAFLGSNALDIETGVAFMDYRRFHDTVTELPLLMPEEALDTNALLVNDKLNSFYISPRISRQFGARSGFNITYIYRRFSDFANRVLFGFSTGFLSPWASVYDGQSISLNIKSHLIQSFLITTGAGYWDKRFFKTIERDVRIIKNIRGRKDYQSRFYLNIQRLFVLSFGATIEPALQFDYTCNKSTLTLYKYSSANVSAGITCRF
jgi:hypothetical protein